MTGKRFTDGKYLIEMTGKKKEYKKNGVVSKLYEDNRDDSESIQQDQLFVLN